MSTSVVGLPTGRRGQALAVGLTLVVLAVVWLGLVSPVLAWYGQRQDRLEQREILATRMAMVAASAPMLQQQAAAGGTDARPSMLSGATEAIAGAALQQLLQDMAERAAVRMTSVEVLASEQSGSYRRVRVHLLISGTWSRLVRLLSDIDRGTPRMLVTELQIGPSRSVTTSPIKPLDASMTVVALYAGSDAAK